MSRIKAVLIRTGVRDADLKLVKLPIPLVITQQQELTAVLCLFLGLVMLVGEAVGCLITDQY